jgi:ATP phosphoribosyltransferase regulatory subunit HisZ
VAVFDALIAQEALNDEQASALRQIFVKRLASPSSFINALNLFAFLSVLLLKNTAKSGTERLTDADIEVIVLMLESLKLLAIEPIVLSLGNVAVFDVLIAQEALNDAQFAG